MESILKAIKKKKIPIVPKIVISNKPDAKGLRIAQRLGVPTEVIMADKTSSSETRAKYDARIIKTLNQYGVTPDNGLICLAGFMRILGPKFVKKYKNRIMNIHPSLLPAFAGLDSQKQALDYGVKYSGCTVHFVDAATDTGPIIIQSAVKVRKDDDVATLSKRILREEHKIYPEAVNLFARKRIKMVKKGKKITTEIIG